MHMLVARSHAARVPVLLVVSTDVSYLLGSQYVASLGLQVLRNTDFARACGQSISNK
jgi:hypothetical protein